MTSQRARCLIVLAACLSGCAGKYTYVPMVTETRSSPWKTPIGHGRQIDTAHYRIFTTASSRDVLNYLPGFMEASYQNYLALTGLGRLPADQRMDIYMMGSRQEWAELTSNRLGPLAGQYLGIEAGGYCHDKVCVFWDMGGLGTFSVAAHEGLHQFFAYRLREHLPAWLEEGLCVTAEGYDTVGRTVAFTPDRNVPRFGNLRQAMVQGRWYPLDQLLAMDAGDITGQVSERAVGYYGQLWALVQFIRSSPGYCAGLSRLLADAESGRLLEGLKLPAGALGAPGGRELNRAVSQPLFRKYISNDPEGFEREFREFAVKLAGLQ